MTYRLLLGREPENAAVVEHHAKSASSLVFEIAEKAGCRVLEVQPDNCLGQPQVVSNTFLLQKGA